MTGRDTPEGRYLPLRPEGVSRPVIALLPANANKTGPRMSPGARF